jgi:hypothetical protein
VDLNAPHFMGLEQSEPGWVDLFCLRQQRHFVDQCLETPRSLLDR